MIKKINIGLLGYGTVGSGVDKILRENKSHIAESIYRQTGQTIELVVKRILVRDLEKYGDKADGRFTDKADEILEDEEIDIICELIGGEDYARDLILKSFKLGKHVVTANKMAIFKSQGLLEEKAIEEGVYFNYEASVAGVIPIIRAIEESLIADRITEISGILNGSTNYILTQLEEGREYDEVIAEAKAEGYLEADPSSDLKGEDPMYKLGILGYLATGEYPKEEDIFLEGIEHITREDLETAKDKGATIKLIASLKREAGELVYRVSPELVYEDNPLYMVRNTTNAVLLSCENSGEFSFTGRGAGSLETATAVIGDLVAIAKKI